MRFLKGKPLWNWKRNRFSGLQLTRETSRLTHHKFQKSQSKCWWIHKMRPDFCSFWNMEGQNFSEIQKEISSNRKIIYERNETWHKFSLQTWCQANENSCREMPSAAMRSNAACRNRKGIRVFGMNRLYSHRKNACESVIAGKIEKRTDGQRESRKAQPSRSKEKSRERKTEKRNIAWKNLNSKILLQFQQKKIGWRSFSAQDKFWCVFSQRYFVVLISLTCLSDSFSSNSCCFQASRLCPISFLGLAKHRWLFRAPFREPRVFAL